MALINVKYGFNSCGIQIFDLPLHHPPRVVGNAEERPMSVRGDGSAGTLGIGECDSCPSPI